MPYISDRIAYPQGTAPTLGAAGFQFLDPVFSNLILRVTDANTVTDLGSTGKSFTSPASGYNQAWNINGTKFSILISDGNAIVYSFNRTTKLATRIGGYLPLGGSITWSDSNPDLIYGSGPSVAEGRNISYVDTSVLPFAATLVVSFDTFGLGLDSPRTYPGALTLGGGCAFATFGGTGQETHKYAMWYPLASPGSKKIINTSTLNGMDEFNSHFTMHSAQGDKGTGAATSGRFMSLIPTEQIAPVAPFKTYIYDTQLNTVTPVRDSSEGHEVLGHNGRRINSDVLLGNAWDGVRWVFTPSLLTPNTGRIDLTPHLTPTETYVADHTSWHNSSPTSLQPFCSGIYRYNDGDPVTPNTTPLRALDGEIVLVHTDGSGAIWRFGHHRSIVSRLDGEAPGSDNFNYTPRPNIDPTGMFAMFTSNWQKSLGLDSGRSDGIKRVDVFIIELDRGIGAGVTNDPRVLSPRFGRKFFLR